MLSRRSFLAAAGSGLVAATAATPAMARPIPPLGDRSPIPPFIPDRRYLLQVPELYANTPTPPAKSDVIIVGSGFGAAVTALRLCQAGITVTMLERGSRWPRDPWRQIFSGEALPDGRGFWFRRSFTGVTKVPVFFDSFGGALDVTDYANISVWRGSIVGGGSQVFTGALVQPEEIYFDRVFRGVVNYGEMATKWYPLAKQMLRASTVPTDIYNSAPFGHSRVWDAQASKAGYTPIPSDSIFNWAVIRDELNFRSRPSATVGESNLGNSNGAKYDLTQNYLKDAEATGRLTIYPRQVVRSISQDKGTYSLEVEQIEPGGRRQGTIRTLTAKCVFLGAGSIGTSELLVRARAKGTLKNLNEHVGQGWGSNGDSAVSRSFEGSEGLTTATPSASRLTDARGALPTTLENWYIPGLPLNVGVIASLGIVLDSTRASFRYDAATDDVVLDWPKGGNDAAVAATRVVNNRIAAAAGVQPGLPFIGLDVDASFTAHPLGGAVLGKATDAYGRVKGHPGLYVTDGACIPGSTAAVNPSLTITAIAERNIDAVLKAKELKFS